MEYFMGETFNKEKNKPYKKLDAAEKAAEKQKAAVFDESGAVVKDFRENEEKTAEQPQTATDTIQEQQATNSADQTDQEKKTDAETDQEQQQATMTDTVPEGALDTDADGNAPTYDADGNQVGTATPEEIAKAEEMITDTIDGVPAVRITGKIRRVVNGSIRIRNAPSWDNEAVRGAAAFTEKEVTHVMEVDGQPMYKTLDGYFISGDPKLVEYIEE